MKRILFLLWIVAAICLLPFTNDLWLSDESPLWNRFTYQMAHAHILHLCLNAIGWFSVMRLVTAKRTFVAFLLSAFMPLNEMPIVGWSVIICFYVGCFIPNMSNDSLLKLLLLTIISFFVPGIAALQHLLMMSSGFVYRLIEREWEKTNQ